MENLEKYIQDNLEQFNKGEMPAGHQERFLAKLEALKSQVQHKEPKPHHLPIRRILFAASAAAAAIIIALFAILQPGNIGQSYSIGIQEMAQEMYTEEAEILQMLPEDDLQMINSVKSITQEAVPLTDLLPDELSPEKRAEILREYYKAKTAGLKKIKTLYAQSDEPID
ncbi:MAG: hypothetical protein IJE52_06675 [Bacteroidales bacterium]|nr:hypothetical protein [Bacteroidales bacterium]